MFNLIIFSRDRACQLDLLLRSLSRCAGSPFIAKVIYTYTTECFRRGYELVQDRHRWPIFLPEVHFRVDTLAAVDPTVPYTFFLMDDQIVRRAENFGRWLVEPLEDESIACVSLRMSPSVGRCYTHNRATTAPAMEQRDRFFLWTWPNQSGDWGYPMSLDGHVFRTADIRTLMSRLAWSNPNTLEGELSANPLPRNRMACLAESAVVNIPQNRVQNVYGNRVMQSGMSAEDLNRAWLDGQMIDLATLLDIVPVSPHMEAEYTLRPWSAT